MLPTHLDGPGFVLRPWCADDRAALRRHIDDPAVARNLRTVPHPYTDADAEAWLAHAPTAPGTWAIEVATDRGPEAVGTIALEPGANIERWAWEVGYWLARPWWGRGIMTAAVRMATDAAFAVPEVTRVYAPVFSWNPASMRVLEKAGFRREAVLERAGIKEGTVIDRVIFARTRDTGLPYVPFRPADAGA